jgi:ABC-type Fe3+/spermidine/putrescine transport system ATPase subunit
VTSVGIHELRKSFNRKTVLGGVSLRVNQGEFLTLLGSSGCGKTTTLRCIAGLEEPDSGEIRLGDKTIFGAGINVAARRRELGMVFQSYALWPHMTVAENVAFGLRVRKHKGEARNTRVRDVLEVVGLGELRDSYPYQLSGGQQQRVGLARALAYEPKVLLLDEPLSNLDATLRDQLRLEIRRIQQSSGITALYVTHDTREALSMSDTICLMRSGRILHQSSPEEMWKSPESAYAAAFLNAGTLIEAEIAEVTKSFVRVNVAGSIITAEASPGASWRSGDACALLIRHAELSPSIRATGSSGNAINVSILVSASVGESRETDVLVGDQKVRVVTSADGPDLTPGTSARLHFASDSALALPKL